MPVIFRHKRLTKPKLRNVRRSAYLNGKKLWVQPPSTTKQGTSPQYQMAPLFHSLLTVTASSNDSSRGSPQNIIDEK